MKIILSDLWGGIRPQQRTKMLVLSALISLTAIAANGPYSYSKYLKHRYLGKEAWGVSIGPTVFMGENNIRNLVKGKSFSSAVQTSGANIELNYKRNLKGYWYLNGLVNGGTFESLNVNTDLLPTHLRRYYSGLEVTGEYLFEVYRTRQGLSSQLSLYGGVGALVVWSTEKNLKIVNNGMEMNPKELNTPVFSPTLVMGGRYYFPTTKNSSIYVDLNMKMMNSKVDIFCFREAYPATKYRMIPNFMLSLQLGYIMFW